MGEKGTALKGNMNKQGWEQSDFPILCDTCLGDNPFVRMTKSEFARECKVCQRPFCVFRWKPDSKRGGQCRYKKTEICQTCAKLKNVCQTCLFDLDFGLPVGVRDQFLEQQSKTNGVANQKIVMPTDRANKDYWANIMNANIDVLDLPYDQMDPDLQKKLAHAAKFHKAAASRNRAHVCSFFVRGECNRGQGCPYRHTDITERDLEALKKGYGSIESKIKERYHGVNDPIADKILNNIKETPKVPDAPEDLQITTLFMGGITAEMKNDDILQQMSQFGQIKSVKLLPKKNCGFVCFLSREGAQKAISTLHDKFYMGNAQIKLLWAKKSDDNQTQKQKQAKNQQKKEPNTEQTPTAPKEEQKEQPNFQSLFAAYASDDEKSD